MITLDDIFKIGFEYLQNFYYTSRVFGVSTDSRTLKKGDAFFALKGEKFDGHKYLKQVFELGASLAVVEESWFKKNRNLYKDNPILVVNDTSKALGTYAKNYRSKFNIPVIAIAGSNGKTTTKDMIAAVLSAKYNVLRTEGNLNNHIGVPLMIFKMNPKTEIAVIEIGTNHPGEISYLCDILNPNQGLITNIGKEHLEFFRNLEGVRSEEAVLFDYIASNNGAIYMNADDELVKKSAPKMKKKISYGFGGKVDYKGSINSSKNNGQNELQISAKGKNILNLKLSLPGKHNMTNALVSVAIGLQFGINKNSLKEALINFKPSFGRMELLEMNGIKIIKDCYNSNPDSLKSGLETLAEMKSSGNKFVVLGDMLEIGVRAPEEHRLAGEIIKKLGFEYIFLYGAQSKYTFKELENTAKYCKYYNDKFALSKDLKGLVKEGDLIFVKGSRGMQMETVLDGLTNLQ
jgi:UDP-N-acetylmuramoyl-tripeptide--D-alanyl-D-alanine ligase